MKFQSRLLKQAAPVTEQQERLFRSMGQRHIEEVQVGDYELHLVDGPGPYPQIGLQKPGTDFTSITQQRTKTPGSPGQFDAALIKSTIKRWLAEYGGLLVGSFNEGKLDTYERMFKLMKFQVIVREQGYSKYLEIHERPRPGTPE